jgi:hypothetical protein
MASQYVKFAELPLNCQFLQHGNQWVKRSSRTAYLPEYKRTFYFKQDALCIVGLHSRLDKDYF